MRIRMLEPVQNKIPKKKRVCAYARVSMDSRKQGESLENQVSSYERSLNANPEYEFVGVFADQGISGFSRNRPEFQRMVQMAKDGQIDLIITKSISRFARNTAVLLETVRELRLIGVAVYFEKEYIQSRLYLAQPLNIACFLLDKYYILWFCTIVNQGFVSLVACLSLKSIK